MELTLTKAEEKAMKILWSLERGVIRDIVEQYEDPKPAYTTVATIFKILEKKGFVGRKPIANTHQYYPLVDKKEYTRNLMKSIVQNYFSNSFKRMVSELSSDGNLSTSEIEELIEYFKNQIEEKNKK